MTYVFSYNYNDNSTLTKSNLVPWVIIKNTYAPKGSMYPNAGILEQYFLKNSNTVSSQLYILALISVTGIVGSSTSNTNGSADSIISKPSRWPTTWNMS